MRPPSRKKKPSVRRLRYSRAGIVQPDAVDGRSRPARRFRRLCQEFEAEAGGQLSAIDRALIGQAAGLVERSEAIQARIVAGEAVDVDEAVRLASEARRILSSLKGKATKNAPDNRFVPIRERLLFDEDGPA
jgi:hypothetical protein